MKLKIFGTNKYKISAKNFIINKNFPIIANNYIYNSTSPKKL